MNVEFVRLIFEWSCRNFFWGVIRLVNGKDCIYMYINYGIFWLG